MQLRGAKSGLIALTLGAMALGVTGGSALADKRVALVIGNAAYKNFGSLRNPINDARGVKEALEKIGFQTELVTDVDERSFHRKLIEFRRRATDATQVVVYYAGHGIEEGQSGYLLPIDVDSEELSHPELSQVPTIETVVSAINVTHGVKVLIVDACREDPTAKEISLGDGVKYRGVTRSIDDAGESRSPGETPIDNGVMIVYSTAARQVAYDGVGSQGPFASSLIRRLAQPRLKLSEMFHKVTDDVLKETHNLQRTNVFDNLNGEYWLNDGVAEDELAWTKLANSEDPEEYERFVERFPQSAHAAQAAGYRDLLRKLTQERDDRHAAEESAWNDTQKAGTPESFAKFAENYPVSRHAPEATQSRARLLAGAAEASAWDGAVQANSVEGFEKFASLYANSPRKADAFQRRDRLKAAAVEAAAWEKANRDGTPDALDTFARLYPSSEHRAEALQARDRLKAAAAEALAWAKAKKDNSADGFDRFASAFPDSAHRQEAAQMRDRLRDQAEEAQAWAAASKEKTAESFGRFAEAFPGSAHVEEALRKRGEIVADERDNQEKIAFASAERSGMARAFDIFMERFPNSARLAEAQRKRDQFHTAELARADAAVKTAALAEICRKEGEELTAKIAAHADPETFEALLSIGSCDAEKPAIFAALAQARKAKTDTACAADRASFAGASADPSSLRAALVGMSCEPVRQQAQTTLARLEDSEKHVKADAQAKAEAANRCVAAGLDLDSADLYDQPAYDRIVALRDKSGCADAAFVQRTKDLIARIRGVVQVAQREMTRIGCYSGPASGVFDAPTRKAVTTFVVRDSGEASPSPDALRISPDLLERLKGQGAGACTSAPAVASAVPESPTAAKPQAAPSAPAPVKANVQPPAKRTAIREEPRVVPHEIAAPHRERPAPRPSVPVERAPREAAVVHHRSAAPEARPVAAQPAHAAPASISPMQLPM